jgi:hypothetical protein
MIHSEVPAVAASPVNAIRPFTLDQLARVADTGKGAADSRLASPPDTGTTKRSQVRPSSMLRLKRTVLPSGAKHGQISIAAGS